MALLTGTSTSNSVPYTITSDPATGEPWKVFDGANITSGAYNWYPTVNTFPATITIDFGANVTVTSYKLHCHEAPNDETYDAPKNFKLQYSANGSDWTDLDTQTNQTTYTSGASAFSASVTSTIARYWRLYCSATRNDRIYLALSEFELYGTGSTTTSTSTTSTTTSTSTTSTSTSTSTTSSLTTTSTSTSTTSTTTSTTSTSTSTTSTSTTTTMPFHFSIDHGDN